MSVKGEIRYLGHFSFGELETHTNRFLDISAVDCWLIHQNNFRRFAARGQQTQSIRTILSG